MKKDKFFILNLVKELIADIDKYLINFPNKEIELKREIKENTYKMLLEVYEANCTTDILKRKNIQESIIAKIGYLDFLINLCYDKQLINGKKYLKFGESLNYILKYVNGWLNQTKNQGKVVLDGVSQHEL